VYGGILRTDDTDRDATIIDLQRQIESCQTNHEQEEKAWEAADAAFLDKHTFFHRDAATIATAITSKFATSPPKVVDTATHLNTNLGAEVHIYTNGKNVTSASVSFPDSKRDHGVDVVEIVASQLTGDHRGVANVVRFASLRSPDDYGVVLLRTTNAIVGTNTKDGGRITVEFTPTRNK
jgi:hypothetical protein